MQAAGLEITSSQDLGNRLGISSAQIRKDLSQFGEFGKQGTGYNVAFLAEQLERILRVDRVWDMVLVGAGDLGTAVANYNGFLNRGYRITAVYDSDPEKVGRAVGALTIKDISSMEQDVKEAGIQIAMLTVPAGSAQSVSESLIKAGIKAFLCYAPTSLNLPEDVHVQYIDPVLSLQRMTYYIPEPPNL
jgi:redox-sensing transcriptional repressor